MSSKLSSPRPTPEVSGTVRPGCGDGGYPARRSGLAGDCAARASSGRDARCPHSRDGLCHLPAPLSLDLLSITPKWTARIKLKWPGQWSLCGVRVALCPLPILLRSCRVNRHALRISCPPERPVGNVAPTSRRLGRTADTGSGKRRLSTSGPSRRLRPSRHADESSAPHLVAATSPRRICRNFLGRLRLLQNLHGHRRAASSRRGVKASRPLTAEVLQEPCLRPEFPDGIGVNRDITLAAPSVIVVSIR